MVLPLLGALAGAGGSIGAALLGGEAQSEATQYNWMANMYNLRQRKAERQQSMDYANELRAEQKLGSTDASGNRTYYKEGEGWVTELSDDQQALSDRFYNQELPERQGQFDRKAEASRTNHDMAGSLLEQFNRVYKENPAEVEAMLYEVATRGIGEASNDTTEAAMRQAARTGNSGIDKIMSGISKANMEARGNARMQAKLQAGDYSDQKYNQQRGQLGSLYQMFAQQAGQDIGASYDPSGASSEANGLMRFFAQNAQQGNAQGLSAVQMNGGSLQDIEPDLGAANAMGAIGASLSGLGDRAGAIGDKNQQNALLMQYMNMGGDINASQGGFFGSINDRLAASKRVY